VFGHVQNELGHIDRSDTGHIRHGNGLLRHLLDPLGVTVFIDRGRALGHESPFCPQNHNGAGLFQIGVGVSHGIQINFQQHRDLPHGGHLLAGTQHTCANGPQHLLTDLHVDGNAVVLQLQGRNHAFQSV
jgi:hypothetical protein